MSTVNGHTEHIGSLPTFTSIHDQPHRPVSYAESSRASSSQSAVNRTRTRDSHGSEQEDRPGDSLVVKEEDPVQRENALNNGNSVNGVNNVNGSVKRAKRASGGFLLESSPTSSRLSRSLLSRKLHKGKQKLDSQALSVPKRLSHLDGQDSRSSIGASPLSSEFKSSPPLHDRVSSSPPPPDVRNDSPSLPFTASIRSHGSASSKQQNSSYGFDSDPAQIVEMALRLNEGRRRQASGRRYVSSGMDGKRIVSAAASLPPKSSPPTRADKQTTLRSIPAPRSRELDPVTPQKRPRDLEPDTIDSSPLQLWSPEQDAQDMEDAMQISRATQNRVNKAKTYFELAYEHRRLLSHLPPTRSPGIRFDPDQPGYDSKAYNPLQYARNRKLRLRERAALDPANDGWHDVLKVRAWVDAVINSHSSTKHDPLECLRLPPLTLLDRQNSEADHDSNAGTKPTANTTRARRPKSDWVTHPGDLLADAFWTEQGLNKQKIYNRDNEPIYPPGTKFKFSGWRNMTPLEVPDQLLSSSSPEDSPDLERKKSLPAPPNLPTFESAHKDHTWARTRSKFSKALNKRSKSAKDKEHDIFNTSSESSDSNDDTEPGKEPRGRKRLKKRQEKLFLPDGDPFAQPARGANRNHSSGVESSLRGSQPESVDHVNMPRHLRRDSSSVAGTHGENERQKLAKRRGFLNSIRLESDHERGRSSFDDDSTAPPTPAVYGFPSIAINLSPPESRSQSPTRRNKGSFLGVVKDKMQPQKDRIDRTDFARDQSSGRGSREHISASHHKKMSYDVSRGTSPMTRGISPFAGVHARSSLDEDTVHNTEPRNSTLSKVSSKTTDSGMHRSHRVRGMFKGGRIAELVGNEVSRVGDFIWKRDPPRRSDFTESGSTSGYESDSDDRMGERSKPERPSTRPNQSLPSSSPSSQRNLTPPSGPAKPTPHEKPQYHIQGLPSFTSPFQRDRQEQESRVRAQSPGGTPQRDPRDTEYDSDPISTAAKARRAAGRSPRFDNLAPPRLDIRAATPDGRRSSYGFGAALDLSRTRSASQLFNSAINAINGEPLQAQFSRDQSSIALSRFQSTDLTKVVSNESGIPKHVKIQDCLRTRSLLVAIAVKATNIADYYDAIPEAQSSFLYSAVQTTGALGSEIDQYLPARRREEHVIAARLLISHLNDQASTFNDHLTHFTTFTTPNLQREIQILEDRADHTLFPRLQSLSDSAGQLAQQLTTTSALAVKSVNDEVAEARRLKYRGPGVFGRWMGYKLAEWGVVGVLWAIWFVVKVVRFCTGTVRCVWTIFAWLFWLR